jgi:lipoprotein NlpI
MRTSSSAAQSHSQRRTTEGTRVEATIHPRRSAVQPHRVYVTAPRVLWPCLAGAVLLLASVVPWVAVPLIQSTSSWALPLDLGWGVQNRVLSYGALCVVAAGVCLGRALLALDGSAIPLIGVTPWRLRPLRMRTLTILGMVAGGPSLLLIFQVVAVGGDQVVQWVDQENQGLLIRRHLGYGLAPQHLPMLLFHVPVDSPGDRFALLVQLCTPGALLPLLALLACFFGAALTRQSLAGSHERPAPPPRRKSWRAVCLLVLGLVVVVVLARAPLGLVYESMGRQSLANGDYASALEWFDRAAAFDPALAALSGFHQERGAALYLLHRTADTDVGLYLAAQDRAAGALGQAWLTDSALLRQYPRATPVLYDSILTLELLAETNTRVELTPPDPEASIEQPILEPQKPDVDRALPWQDRLLQVQPASIYAHYLRGRTLFAVRSYELAARDFRALLTLSTSKDMQSTSYTYLAFCRAGLGDYQGERSLLQQAIRLDPGYYNTTAREAASGLH